MRKGGFEPPRLSAPPPQDGVSANSTTSAKLERCQRFIGYFETDWVRRFSTESHSKLTLTSAGSSSQSPPVVGQFLVCRRIGTHVGQVVTLADRRRGARFSVDESDSLWSSAYLAGVPNKVEEEVEGMGPSVVVLSDKKGHQPPHLTAKR